MGTHARLRARASVRRDSSAVEELARHSAAAALEAQTSSDVRDGRASAVEALVARDQAHAYRSVLANDAERAKDAHGDVEVANVCDACRACDDACANESCASCVEKKNRNRTIGEHASSSFWTPCVIVRERRRGRAILAAAGEVYDATEFLREHPSGPAPILRAMGRDNTIDLDMHSSRAKKIWRRFHVGRLVPCAEKGYGIFEPPPRHGFCAIQ